MSYESEESVIRDAFVPKKNPNYFHWIVLSIIIMALVVAGFVFRKSLFTTKVEKPYSAVFLTSGQVYFGKLDKGEGQSVLTDVYHMQLIPNGSTTQPTLIKRGQELHGPKDSMVINNDHILIIEELTESSQVMKGIVESKKAPAQ